MTDIVDRAKAALEGITPGTWEHRTAPSADSDETHAEYLAGALIGEGEPLHVLIAPSPDPKFAYIVPALTGDGPASEANAEFIAAARTLVPELLAEVERLSSYKSLPEGMVWQDYYSPDDVCKIREPLEDEAERLRADYAQAVDDWGANDEQMLAENARLAAELLVMLDEIAAAISEFGPARVLFHPGQEAK